MSQFTNAWAAMLRKRVSPEYVESGGVVRLSVVVARDGTVKEVSPLVGSGPAMAAAIQAVGKWQYAPTRLNGIRTEVIATVELKLDNS